MSNSTYLFYDIETTGLNKCFDQVLQFAAIRTDLAFNELSREEIFVKLNNDVIPSPGAIVTHRIGVNQFSQGLSEYDAIQKIHTLLNEPNTISVGYNTLGFDDEFLRFSFYKNLLPPYTHQYANQCGRMDIYPIVMLYYLFKPAHLQWPTKNDVVSFKLENLNIANQLGEGQAHNAMVDVEITLALAKKLAQDKTMWDFVTDYFNKKVDDTRVSPHQFGLLVNAQIGHAANFIAPVMSIGQHLHYKNQSLWLRLDKTELSQTTIDTIAKNTKMIRKRLGEPPIFLPIKKHYLDLLSDERKKIVESNKVWIEKNTELLKSITAYYQHLKYPEVDCDIDAALYQLAFSTAAEEKLFQAFHAATPDKKLSIVKKFPNKTRQAQGIRIIARHFPQYLTEEHECYFKNYVASDPLDFRGEKKLGLTQAMSDIEHLQKTKALDEQQVALLKDLYHFLEQRQQALLEKAITV